MDHIFSWEEDGDDGGDDEGEGGEAGEGELGEHLFTSWRLFKPFCDIPNPFLTLKQEDGVGVESFETFDDFPKFFMCAKNMLD